MGRYFLSCDVCNFFGVKNLYGIKYYEERSGVYGFFYIEVVMSKFFLFLDNCIELIAVFRFLLLKERIFFW